MNAVSIKCEVYVGASYRFLGVTPARPDWLMMGNGTDCTAALDVARGDAEETAVLEVRGNLSSPFFPEKP